MDQSKAYPYLKALLDALIEAAPGVVKAPAVFLSSLAEQLKDKQEEEVKQLEQEIKSITQDELVVMLKEAGCDQKENIEFIVEAVRIIPQFSQRMDYGFDKVDKALEEIRRLLKIPSEKFPQFPLSPSLHNQTPPEENFVGRREMLKTITQWYQSEEVRIGALIGWGGVGKSALIRKWYDSLSENNIQPDGIFWWGFYRNAYLEQFLNALLNYVSQGQIDPGTIKNTWEKAEKIKGYIHQRRYLIILDGLEEMQRRESGDGFGRMEHREFAELLHYLADTPTLGLCLITTRFKLKDLEKWHNQGYNTLELIDLGIPDALTMLKKRGIKGDDESIKEAITRYKGHALSLTLLAGFLNKYYAGDIKQAPDIRFVLSDEERFKDVHKLLKRYSEKMSAAELVFLKIFSLFRKEITERDFAGVFRYESGFNESLLRMNDLDFKDLVNGLVDWRLISEGALTPSPFPLPRGERIKERGKRKFNQDNTYTTHPLIKGYFESIFEEQDKRLCHKRIYEYIGSYAPGRPETLEEMQPLFEQVYHGCAAGLYDEVYRDVYQEKIYRGEERFIIHKLGAWETGLSLAKTFFPNNGFSQMPLVSKKKEQSWLINEAGLTLLSTGKPKEAEDILERLFEMDTKGDDLEGASVTLQNLADLQFRTGRLKQAHNSAQKALELAEKTKSDKYICTSKAYLAWTLHLLGRQKEAENWFKQADELSKKIWGERRYSFWITIIFYADFFLSTKQVDEAFELIQANLEICQRNEWSTGISRCYRCLSAIERLKGNQKEAEAYFQKALEIAKKVGMPALEIEALLESGRLHLDMNQHKDTIYDANQVLKLVARTGFKLYEPDAELILSRAYLAQKDFDQAKSLAQSAYAKAGEMHYFLPKKEASQLLEKIKTA